jgi:hypothetical protein
MAPADKEGRNRFEDVDDCFTDLPHRENDLDRVLVPGVRDETIIRQRLES